MIKVIINGDDFGYGKVFNEKMLELLEKGAIKSVTVLVNRISEEQKDQVSRLINLHFRKNVGVGIEFEVNPERSVDKDLREQYQKFLSIFGFPPSHFNEHLPKSLMSMPNSSQIVKQLSHEIFRFAKTQKVPMNKDVEYGIEDWAGVVTTSQPLFVGTKHTFGEIREYFEKMEDGKAYEVLFHPGEYDPSSTSSLNAERDEDYKNILKLQEFLNTRPDIRIMSYLELRNKRRKTPVVS